MTTTSAKRTRNDSLCDQISTLRISACGGINRIGQLLQIAAHARNRRMQIDALLSLVGVSGIEDRSHNARRYAEPARIPSSRRSEHDAQLRRRTKVLDLLRHSGERRAAAAGTVELIKAKASPALEFMRPRVMVPLMCICIQPGCSALAAAKARRELGQCAERDAWRPDRFMALSQAAVCLMNNMTSAFEFNCNPVTNVQVADCPAPEFEDATAGYTELRSRRDAIPGGAAQRPPQTLDRARLIKDAADLEVEVLKEDTGPARLLLSGRTASHRCGREGVRARMDLNSAAIPILVCPPEATGCATSTRGRAAISGRPRHLHDPVEPRARRFSDSNRPDAAVAVVCSVSE